ncbi:hypothetical protein C8R46DRAFT_1050884 [Mycena filopes]|nr:hypothetical protein C8R46DRAFT_1050884 [Mycena filopes]
MDLPPTNPDEVNHPGLNQRDFSMKFLITAPHYLLNQMHPVTEEPDGEWRANALEVLIALQKSFSKLTGSGKIGVPDRLHPTYTEYFVELIAEQPIEMLTISNLPPATAFGDSGLSPASTSPGAVAGSSNSSTGVEARLQDPLREIEWLKSKLSTRLGYAKFTTSHHKILQNVERVRYWRFAADFTSDFHKKAWPHDVSSSKTISKAAIEKALQMSRSALVDANQMIELIDRFTAEGSNYSQQVADTVDKSDDEAPSAANLKAFLKEWDSEHGGQSWEE